MSEQSDIGAAPEMVSVPRDLLLEVCERATSDNAFAEGEWAVGKAEHDEYERQRARIAELLAYAKNG